MTRSLFAEIFGTFWLVLGGCGAAVFAAGWGAGPNGTSLGIGFMGVSLAFGFTVVTGAYAVGHVSGGHFNPAVTLGLTAGGRFPAAHVPGYIIAQVIGAILGAYTVYAIASGQGDFGITDVAGTFATNGYGDYSPTKYSVIAALIAEVVLTAIFLIIIMGATSRKAAPAMGGLAIGLGLTLIHLISIPVTNTSVNPARSTGAAVIAYVFGDGGVGAVSAPVEQLWLFWAAPIVGGIIGALIYRGLISNDHVVD